MAINNFFRLLFVTSGRKINAEGKRLCGYAENDEQREAAAAYRRVKIGTALLTAGLMLSLVLVTVLNFPVLASGNVRYGRVQADGKISYVQNEMKYAAPEELGLSGFDLQSGDRVIIYFKGSDDTVIGAYPKAYVDDFTVSRLKYILLYALLCVTLIIVFALVICRLTPFGRPWYLYCRKLKQLSEPKLSLGKRVAVNIISVAAALLICSPQLMAIIGEVRHLQEIEAMNKIYRDASEAADKADKITEALDSMNTDGADSAVEDAKNAADKIRDALSEINGNNGER